MPTSAAGDRILHVEQAEVVLAALAQHDAAVALGGVGEEPFQLRLHLPLQMAGEGRDPDRRMVALGPEARGRHIAERLAGARAGFGQHDIAARLPPRAGLKAAAAAEA